MGYDSAKRDMTCRGRFDISLSPAAPKYDVRTIGTPERTVCYLWGNPEASAIIDAACKDKSSCAVRARVAPRNAIMPPTYNILKVYSAREGSR